MPSESDIAITKKLMQAGEVVNIQVYDHIVITSEGYVSLGDEGRL
jgi:DNA repair protein RadC